MWCKKNKQDINIDRVRTISDGLGDEKDFLGTKSTTISRKRHEAVHKLINRAQIRTTCQLGIDLGFLVLDNYLLLIGVLRWSNEYSLDVLVKDDIFTDL